jgi:hypothetical protein
MKALQNIHLTSGQEFLALLKPAYINSLVHTQILRLLYRTQNLSVAETSLYQQLYVGFVNRLCLTEAGERVSLKLADIDSFVRIRNLVPLNRHQILSHAGISPQRHKKSGKGLTTTTTQSKNTISTLCYPPSSDNHE